jgi:hypothetical protein
MKSITPQACHQPRTRSLFKKAKVRRNQVAHQACIAAGAEVFHRAVKREWIMLSK